MHPHQIAFKEMIFRWRTSLLLVVIVGAITGLLSFFSVNKAGYQKEVARSARDIGSNVVILPSSVDQVAYHANGGYSKETMSDEVIEQLIEYKASLNHLIPMLEVNTDVQQGEQKSEARVVGIAASIPMPGRPKAPMQKAVKENTVQVGSSLARKLEINRDLPGSLMIKDREFQISRVNAESGTWQDAVVFMNLIDAQTVFNKPHQLSRIEAIECTSEKCEEFGVTSTEVLTHELTNITDKAQLLRRQKIAAARTSLRNLSVENARLLSNVLWIFLAVSIIAFSTWNTLQRSSEIGLFRAVGFGTGKILATFSIRGVCLSVLGTVVGVAIGALISLQQVQTIFANTGRKISLDWLELSWIGLLVVLLSTFATMIPAMIGASQHPASIIGKDSA